MARYETLLHIDRPIQAAFAFVSDFSNAAKWDPRTYAAHKETDGPVGVGTRFVLTGGAIREGVLRRLRLPPLRVGQSLPYDIVEFEPPVRFVLHGETGLYRYDDHLDFTAEDGGTSLRYRATLELRGRLGIFDSLLQRMFQRIGDDATRDLAATVEAGT